MTLIAIKIKKRTAIFGVSDVLTWISFKTITSQKRFLNSGLVNFQHKKNQPPSPVIGFSRLFFAFTDNFNPDFFHNRKQVVGFFIAHHVHPAVKNFVDGTIDFRSNILTFRC